jgi:hypothetical protein
VGEGGEQSESAREERESAMKNAQEAADRAMQEFLEEEEKSNRCRPAHSVASVQAELAARLLLEEELLKTCESKPRKQGNKESKVC